MDNKPPLRYSCNREMLWKMRMGIVILFFIISTVVAIYFCRKSNRLEEDVKWLKENTVPSIVRPKGARQ